MTRGCFLAMMAATLMPRVGLADQPAATIRPEVTIKVSLPSAPKPGAQTEVFSGQRQAAVRLPSASRLARSLAPQAIAPARPRLTTTAPQQHRFVAKAPRDMAPEAVEAIGRVAYAEAGDQGPQGLAAVIDTIFNRLHSGRWGGSIRGIIDQPNQFQTVTEAGGSWRDLRPLSLMQEIEYRTILRLILDGGLRDVSDGALYFQNVRMEAAEARAGTVSARMVGFGGSTPIRKIHQQTFYREDESLIASSHRPTGLNRENLFVEKNGKDNRPTGLFVSVNQAGNINEDHHPQPKSLSGKMSKGKSQETSAEAVATSSGARPIRSANSASRASSTARSSLFSFKAAD